jgi:uncharacterized membrane protein YsdA (DUF1294 family)
MYGIDKYKAKKKKWRIPENALLMSAAVGGAFGAYLAMTLFRHKTKHVRFEVFVPMCALLWAGLCIWLLFIVKI